MTTIIQINDNNLLVKQGDELHVVQGYAWFREDQVYFDSDDLQQNAARHSRLFPQQINNQYWQQCDNSPVAKNDHQVRHAADLIWKHLIDLKQKYNLDEVILSVPSHYQTANLQLLLGIAKAAGLSVTGLINNALLSLHNKINKQGLYLHIDMQLHQAVCSTLEVVDGQVKLKETEILQDVGLLAMQDALLKAIQNSFIQNDRFDPLHHAQTEQQLFDQLPEIISKVAQSGKASVSVDYEFRQYSANIDEKQLLAALKPLYDSLNKAAEQQKYQQVFYVANGVQPLGLAKTITVIDEATNVSSNDLLNLMRADTGDSGENNSVYITQCAVGNSEGKAKKVSKKKSKTNKGKDAGQSTNGVTHLLQSGVALPLDKAFVDTGENNLSLINKSPNWQQLLESGTLFIVNDDTRKTLKPNDRLASNIADGVISAIQVQDE